MQLSANQLTLGDMVLQGDTDNLHIKRLGDTIATFSGGGSNNRLMVYRGMTGSPPYLYYNREGNFGEWDGNTTTGNVRVGGDGRELVRRERAGVDLFCTNGTHQQREKAYWVRDGHAVGCGEWLRQHRRHTGVDE